MKKLLIIPILMLLGCDVETAEMRELKKQNNVQQMQFDLELKRLEFQKMKFEKLAEVCLEFLKNQKTDVKTHCQFE
jgi:hypothetical protein